MSKIQNFSLQTNNMKEIIRQILREELGVPKGLLDVSKTVFDDFKNYFLSALDENQSEYNFVIVPTQEAKIGDMVIDEIVLTFKSMRIVDLMNLIMQGWAFHFKLKLKRQINQG